MFRKTFLQTILITRIHLRRQDQSELLQLGVRLGLQHQQQPGPEQLGGLRGQEVRDREADPGSEHTSGDAEWPQQWGHQTQLQAEATQGREGGQEPGPHQRQLGPAAANLLRERVLHPEQTEDAR